MVLLPLSSGKTDKLSKDTPVAFCSGMNEIGPVIEAQTLARQKAITAITNIIKILADLLAILSPF